MTKTISFYLIAEFNLLKKIFNPLKMFLNKFLRPKALNIQHKKMMEILNYLEVLIRQILLLKFRMLLNKNGTYSLAFYHYFINNKNRKLKLKIKRMRCR